MKSPIYLFSFSAILMTAILLSACDRNQVPSPKSDGEEVPSLKVGQPCAVHFRKDIIGDRHNINIDPEIGIWGTFKRATADWIVIEKDGGEFWVPKSLILFVQGGGQIQTK